MSNENIEIVKEAFTHYLAGNIHEFIQMTDENVSWDHRGPEGVPFNKLYQGHQGMGEFFETLAATMEKIEFEPREYFSSEKAVVAVGFYRFRVLATDQFAESDFAFIFTLEGGKISGWRSIYDKTSLQLAFTAPVSN